MSISLNTCILILKEHHLLKSSAVQDTVATKMEYVSYDSRDIETNTLFFCKGAGFRPTYLSMVKIMVQSVMWQSNHIQKEKGCTL